MQADYHLVALGELLIDLTPYGGEGEVYQANAGGAPANVLTVLAKFKKNVAMIARVGNDHFGDILVDTLQREGICTDYISVDYDIPTTLAVVSLSGNGDRSFSFYRSPGADCMLSKIHLDPTLLERCSWFHFGSLSLTNESCKEATLFALNTAKAAGAAISFDPNLRPALWRDLEDARKAVLDCLGICDIVKMSQEEAIFFSGKSNLDDAARYIREQYDLSALFVTLGSQGAIYAGRNAYGQVPTIQVEVVDTTGAGDAFMGMVLTQILDQGLSLDNLSDENLRKITRRANVCGSLATRRRGGIPSIPSMDEVQAIV